MRHRAPGRGTTRLLVALLCLIWGSTWLVIKVGLRDLPPMTSAWVRFAIAAAVFALLAPALHRREGGLPPPVWLSVAMSVLNFAIPYGVVYWGETVIPSGLASVLWAVFPMFVAVGSHVALPQERLKWTHGCGFALGFVGVMLLFVTDLRTQGTVAVGMGAFFLLSPLSAAIGQTLIKRHGERISSVLLNRNGLIGAALLLATAGIALERGAEVRWTTGAVASIAYLSIVGTVVTFGLFFWLLRYAPAYEMSLIAYVTPVVALTLGWGVGEEEIGGHTLVGSALILGGVALVVRVRGRSRASDSSGS